MKPTLALIATGGTIAGLAEDSAAPANYIAGVVDAATLVAAVPPLRELASLQVEQLCNLDSSDLTPAHWLALAQRVQALAADPAIAGIVITHGTDTLEETAAFLALCHQGDTPVVLTGAMRPANALSADGPANLHDACRVALAGDSRGRGVMVVFAGEILPALPLNKARLGLQPYVAGAGGTLGVAGSPPRFFHPPSPAPAVLDAAACHSLPEVAVLYVAAGMPPQALRDALRHGARGAVLALPGSGTVPQAWEETIAEACSAGIRIVRGSRLTCAYVTPRHQDVELGSWAAGALAPAQARAALIAAIAAGLEGLPSAAYAQGG
ncbi:asparaginase [Azoarcus indigens]|uniref:L-asparaginase n=1 Tax=Azoarcus indigens TaxID=29545 RepID=A0A4R6E102_9RHOO|nr:asparaginase [Azoarcus indigens]NMG65501.1 asparaginase [Azoarcus indigens]TDN51380.1 L-asparaginase [Azoarcus indigens]